MLLISVMSSIFILLMITFECSSNPFSKKTMKNQKVYFTLLLALFTFTVNAQSFLKRPGAKPLTFIEMQLQFDKWKNSTDLKKQKNWKSFKRWEMETQYHTDAQGNPVEPSLYINEITKAAQEKEKDPLAAQHCSIGV